jgi:hypothetical protein
MASVYVFAAGRSVLNCFAEANLLSHFFGTNYKLPFSPIEQ